MATYKEEAVVLRTYDLGEADRIISIITAGRGLRRAVAKGVKRTKSKFGARLEPFSHVTAILYEGRNLDTVTQVEIIKTHAAIREDYHKFLYGEAILEMVEKSLQENQVIPRLFDALCTSLDALDGEVSKPALLLAAFELKVCALIGYHPHLDECIHCGKGMGSERASLDLLGGGVVCARCSRGLNSSVALSPGTLELMRRLLESQMAAICTWDENPRLCREVLGTAFRFSESFLERPLKSRQVILQHLEEPPGSVGS